VRGSNRNTPVVNGWVAALAAALVLISGPAAANAPDGEAVWVSKQLNFVYRGFTTKYSCDGLQEKVRRILLKLGARNDLKVIEYDCQRVTPSVHIVMHVLQPAPGTAAQTVAAHWETVDVLADRELLNAAGDCELIAQLDQQVLPLFATRHVDYSARCSAYTPLIGGTRLKLDVLVPDPGAEHRTAAR
jgi:hypothetical protein